MIWLSRAYSILFDKNARTHSISKQHILKTPHSRSIKTTKQWCFHVCFFLRNGTIHFVLFQWKHAKKRTGNILRRNLILCSFEGCYSHYSFIVPLHSTHPGFGTTSKKISILNLALSLNDCRDLLIFHFQSGTKIIILNNPSTHMRKILKCF